MVWSGPSLGFWFGLDGLKWVEGVIQTSKQGVWYVYFTGKEAFQGSTTSKYRIDAIQKVGFQNKWGGWNPMKGV